MTRGAGKFSAFFTGGYTWMVTIFFGFVLLDFIYANLIPESVTAFTGVADFLLYVGFMTILAAFGAIIFGWKSKPARSLYVASLLFLMFEFMIPVLLSHIIPNAHELLWLRLLPSGAASILAFLGLYKVQAY